MRTGWPHSSWRGCWSCGEHQAAREEDQVRSRGLEPCLGAPLTLGAVRSGGSGHDARSWGAAVRAGNALCSSRFWVAHDTMCEGEVTQESNGWRPAGFRSPGPRRVGQACTGHSRDARRNRHKPEEAGRAQPWQGVFQTSRAAMAASEAGGSAETWTEEEASEAVGGLARPGEACSGAEIRPTGFRGLRSERAGEEETRPTQQSLCLCCLLLSAEP